MGAKGVKDIVLLDLLTRLAINRVNVMRYINSRYLLNYCRDDRTDSGSAYCCIVPQMTTDVLSRISEPSSSTASQTRRAVDLGRQVANRVRNHCIVNTLVNGGS